MSRRTGSVIVAAMLVTASVASAQTTSPATGASQNPAGARGQRAGAPASLASNPAAALNTVEDMMDGVVLRRAQKELQLSDAQYSAFLPKMINLQHMRRDHQRNHSRLIMTLRQATRPNAGIDEATMAADVKALDDLEARMMTDERAALAAVDSVLTTFQRARFRVFEENIEREKLTLLAKVMAGPGTGGGPAPAPAASPDSAGS